jgi:hypothetical protein
VGALERLAGERRDGHVVVLRVLVEMLMRLAVKGRLEYIEEREGVRGQKHGRRALVRVRVKCFTYSLASGTAGPSGAIACALPSSCAIPSLSSLSIVC